MEYAGVSVRSSVDASVRVSDAGSDGEAVVGSDVCSDVGSVVVSIRKQT